MPVASLHIHVALKVADFNAAVARMYLQVALPRHVNLYLDPRGADLKVEVVMRFADFDLDRVTCLVFNDLYATAADLIAPARHLRLYGVLVPCIDLDVGV